MPLHPLLLKEAMSGFLPQLDATGLQVYLSKTKKTGNHHLSCAVGSKAVSFHYAAHKTETLSEIISCRSRISLTPLQPVQSDGETSFAAALKELNLLMVLLQCNMHARRKFVEALQNGDKRAKQAIQYYAQIYGIERECDEQNLSTEERTVQRMTRTFPVLEKFRRWAQCHLDSGKAVRGTPFHKALKYLSTRWLGLTCFVIDGRITIDNGEPERQIRWIAKGRDNWKLCGSAAAAMRLAVVASPYATCRRLKINPTEYLTAVFKAVETGLKLESDAESWTPWAWAARSKLN